MVNSKQKGTRGEREWSSFCKSQGYDTRRSQQYCGANGDADVIGIDGLHMEVKRVERLNIYDAINQATADSRDGEMPIVAHRKNNHNWLVTMSAEDFFKLWREYNPIFMPARWEGPFNEAKDDAEVYCGNINCDYNLEEGYESWDYCPKCGMKIIWHEY